MRILTKQDVQGAACKKIAAYLDNYLNELRVSNDADLSEHATTALRSRIREVKSFQNLVTLGDINPALPVPEALADGADDAE